MGPFLCLKSGRYIRGPPSESPVLSLFLPLLLCAPPEVEWARISEIVELYRDGQYDVVKAKLANQGFEVTKSEPDYTLNGRRHEGGFTMSCAGGMWQFSTEKLSYSTERNVFFRLSSDWAAYAFRGATSRWEGLGLQSDSATCGASQRCRSFWGRIGGGPDGRKEFVTASYTYSKPQNEQISPFQAQVEGNTTFRLVKDTAPAKPTRIARPRG